MKKILLFSLVFVFAMSLLVINKAESAGGLCFLCGSGSSCEQCPSPSGKDTFDDRKACESKGCKVSGTTSCSGAANIKLCK